MQLALKTGEQMNNDDIMDIEILADVDKDNLPAVFQTDETPDEIIQKNLAKVQKLYDNISSNDTTITDKINELLKVKTAMLGPMLQMVGNPNTANPDQSIYVGNVTRMIDNLEQSLYKKANFELAQEIDFHHPKIQVAFKFLFEAVIENLEDFLSEDEKQIFIQQFAIAITGIEDELNSKLKGLSASVLSTIQNPLLKRNK